MTGGGLLGESHDILDASCWNNFGDIACIRIALQGTFERRSAVDSLRRNYGLVVRLGIRVDD